MILDEIELGKRYVVGIPETVQREIVCLINRDVRYVYPQPFRRWTRIEIDVLSETSIAKQIKKQLYKRYSLKIDDKQASDIGSVYSAMIPKSKEYLVEIVDHFNWQPGEFADYDSCFWGKNYKAKKILLSNGAKVARFWERKADDLIPVGRAILFPAYRVDKDAFFVFNSYGKYDLWVMSFVIAELFHLDIQPIRLHNEGLSIGLIYINDKGSGYLIGNTEVLQNNPIASYNLCLGEYRMCAFCRCWEAREDMVPIALGQYCCNSCKRGGKDE